MKTYFKSSIPDLRFGALLVILAGFSTGSSTALAMQQNQPATPLTCQQASTACLTFVIIAKAGADGDTHTDYCGLARHECSVDAVAPLLSNLSRVSAMTPAKAHAALTKAGIACPTMLCTGQDNVDIGWQKILDELMVGAHPQDPVKVTLPLELTFNNEHSCKEKLEAGMNAPQATIELPDGFTDVDAYCANLFPPPPPPPPPPHPQPPPENRGGTTPPPNESKSGHTDQDPPQTLGGGGGNPPPAPQGGNQKRCFGDADPICTE